MIEISSTSPKKEEKTKIKGKKKSVTGPHSPKTFVTSLQNSLQIQFEGDLQEMVRELEEQEKRFLRDQSQHELNQYKTLIQKILKTVLEDGFQSQTIRRNRPNSADFLIIKKIDEKLLEITSRITRGSAFNLMKTMEEIRGLIFDLIY